jgi:hypothetical protein
MRKTTTLLTLAAALLGAAAQHAYAVWTEQQITPNSLADLERSWTFKTRDVESFKQVEITVEPKAGKKSLSPFTSGHLSILEGNRYVGEVPVEVRRENGRATFWFRLSPDALAKSKFEAREQAYGVYRDAQGNPVKDAEGKPKVEQMLGGQAYWFYLRDFVRAGSRE